MALGGSMTLNSRRFNAAMRELAKLTGKSFKSVIKSEAAAILKKASMLTGSAKSALITEKYTYKDKGPNTKTIPFVRLNGRKRRVRTIRKKKGGKPNPDWAPLQTELKRLMKKMKQRKGLSKATWLKIAKDVRLPLFVVPGYVSQAYGVMPNSLKSAVKGTEKGLARYYILVENKSTSAMAGSSVKGPGGYQAFIKAMNGRTLFFKKNVETGVFKKMDRVVAKYPGLDAKNI